MSIIRHDTQSILYKINCFTMHWLFEMQSQNSCNIKARGKHKPILQANGLTKYANAVGGKKRRVKTDKSQNGEHH